MSTRTLSKDEYDSYTKEDWLSHGNIRFISGFIAGVTAIAFIIYVWISSEGVVIIW